MPIMYNKFPPTAEDVKLDPLFVSGMTNEHDEGVVTLTVGEEDAFQLALDIQRDPDGRVDLDKVRRGLTLAAAELIDDTTRSMYLQGVEYFIKKQIKSRDNDNK